MRMYIQLIGRIEALPNGAAETAHLTGQHPFDLHDAVTRQRTAPGALSRRLGPCPTAATVRDAEGFVQVQVRHVRADEAPER